MTPSTLTAFSASALCAVAALVVAARAKRTMPDWWFVLGALALAGERFCSGMSLRAASSADFMAWQLWRMMLLALVPGLWLLFSLTYARGNAGEFTRRWRPIWITALALPVALTLAFRDHLFSAATDLGPHRLRLGWPGIAVHIVILIVCVLGLLNLERTYRASFGTMRWRIKFMLLGVGLLLVVRLYSSSQGLLFHSFTPAVDTTNSVAAIIAVLVIFRALLRAGNFETGVYPSHTVLQGSFAVLLAGIYLVLVGAFAKLAARFGGDAAVTIKAFLLLVSLVLLAMVLQSDRLRLRVRQFISRHFERPMYDYRSVWQKFTAGTVSRVEQDDLCRSFVRMTADMFAALAVTIWLFDERNGTATCAASTSLSEAKADAVQPTAVETRDLISHFQNHRDPVDVETLNEGWAQAIRRCCPSDFPEGGDRVCVPLIGHGDVLGMIVVGDRVSGLPFSLQEFDLLKCVGDHAAANLLNVQLSRKLLAAKELEAFQTMATFFVHDLKNAASTLNLMLQNLPVHFDNPEFRADALRAVSKSVTHINRLTGRLALLRNELKIQPAERDLNAIVKAALADLSPPRPDTITTEFGAVSRCQLDADQLQKVIVNLILNAIEAIPADGAVRVSTAEDGGWLVLHVSDNGCGMSDEFLRRSLFRPFQTTKKHGLGIGMFQSRMIVEAHGGRIHVSSQIGRGSTFEIFLPVRRKTE